MRIASACFVLLGLLAIAVNIPYSPVVSLDENFALWLHTHESEVRTQLAAWIIVAGNESVIVPLTLAVAVVVAVVRRSVILPLAIIGAVAMSGAVSLAMKWALPSPHADLSIDDQPALGHMFPSSHMAVVLTLLGMTAVALARAGNLWIALAVCAILGGLMAFGLAFGQYHWISDIAGGAFLAVGVVAAARHLLVRSGARSF